MIPDGENIVSAYLKAETGENVYGKTPKDPDSERWVRLTQLDARSVGGHPSEHLIEFLFQLDCYASKAGVSGSPQKDATLLNGIIRAALVDMPNQDLDVVVTGVDVRGNPRQPDQDFEPARERFILTVVVWMHA